MRIRKKRFRHLTPVSPFLSSLYFTVVTGYQDLKTPNLLYEWGSELKLHHKSEVGLERLAEG